MEADLPQVLVTLSHYRECEWPYVEEHVLDLSVSNRLVPLSGCGLNFPRLDGDELIGSLQLQDHLLVRAGPRHPLLVAQPRIQFAKLPVGGAEKRKSQSASHSQQVTVTIC